MMRDLLIDLAEAERRLRAQLALSGEDGSSQLRHLHEANARELELLVDDEGWPAVAEVGDDGAVAALHIALSAASRPSFQRRCLTLMKNAANRGEIPAWHAATLEDRIRIIEGRPQIYGTQLRDERGHVVVPVLEDEAQVDTRRAAMGLPPLAQALAEANGETLLDPNEAAAPGTS